MSVDGSLTVQDDRSWLENAVLVELRGVLQRSRGNVDSAAGDILRALAVEAGQRASASGEETAVAASSHELTIQQLLRNAISSMTEADLPRVRNVVVTEHEQKEAATVVLHLVDQEKVPTAETRRQEAAKCYLEPKKRRGKPLSGSSFRQGRAYEKHILAVIAQKLAAAAPAPLITQLRLASDDFYGRGAWDVDTEPRLAEETRLLGAESLKQDLRRFRRPDLVGIDLALELYRSSASLPSRISVSVDETSDWSGPEPSHVLVAPTADELLHVLSRDVADDAIKDYLRPRTTGGDLWSHEDKAGLRLVELENPPFSNEMTLHLAPLNYWVVDRFNREMLRSTPQTDPTLFDLRERCLLETMRGTQNYMFPYPSALYVEVCLVTCSDGSEHEQLVVLEKSPGRSDLTRTGHRWTCSVEEGVRWAVDVLPALRPHDVHRVDIGTIVREAVRDELKVVHLEEMGALRFWSVALEYTHLNSAILGTLELKIRGDLLTSRLLRHQQEEHAPGEKVVDFILPPQYIPLHPLKDAVHCLLYGIPGKTEWSGSDWHPTGRLRALLALYERHGKQAVLGEVRAQTVHHKFG